MLAGGTGNDTVFGALGADVLFAGDGPESSERGADAADSFTLFDPDQEDLSAAAFEFLQGLKNTATNVRSLGFDQLVGGIDSDTLVGHRLRPVGEAELLASLQLGRSRPRH